MPLVPKRWAGFVALIVALWWSGGRVCAQTTEEVEDDRILSFEESVAPLQAGRGSKLSLSSEHWKHGARSTCWQWKGRDASISIREPIAYLSKNPDPKETAVSTFVFWLYAPKALTGTLHFDFRKEGRSCAGFDYRLGFTGWRGAWVAFDRDMEGTPEEGMDELVVTAHGVDRGTLFLDHWILASFQDVRHHTADFQAPFINRDTRNHWLVLLQSWQNPLPERAEPLTAEERNDLRTIEHRLCELLAEGVKPKPFKNLKQRFEEYGISENKDGSVSGKPIFFTRYGETYIRLGYRDVSARYNRNKQLLRQANDLLFQIAVACRKNDNAEQRMELERMYLLLTRHLLDQGFAAGSAQGTLHHLGYSMRNFYTAPLLMRDRLRRAGLLEEVQQAMEWFSGVGEVKITPTEPGMDIDAFNTSLIGRLSSILMMPDTPQKGIYMACFSRWVDNGFRITEGLTACFKSDGTVYHHRRHYPAYAVGGFDGAVDAVWLMHGTHFAVSPESHEILKRALLEMRFYCNLRAFPLALSGRHPDGKGALKPLHYLRLALSGSPDRQHEVDPELGAAAMRLTEVKGYNFRKLISAGIRAENDPQGFRIYPYNASASYRHDGWLWTVAGHSRYLWSAEIYEKANLFGRYLTHGSLELLADGSPVTPEGSGFRQEGWDWSHIPGTTATACPVAELRGDVRNVDTFSGYEEMLLSDESYVGGAGLADRGIFAMKLHENDKYNGSLRARKSWFFIDNRVVALGSGIENKTPYEVHTTLFQNYLTSRTQPVRIGDERVTEFPYTATLSAGGVVCDALGTAYFVPQGEVTVRREHQHSLHEETARPTENDFATAWINHGDTVRGAHYEYMAVVHASEEELARYRRELPYEVVRCDEVAHIVRHKADGTEAAAFFEAGATAEGVVAEVSLPSLTLAVPTDRGLTLALTDPDLRLYEGPADEVVGADGRRVERSIYSRTWIDNASIASDLQVVVRGAWQADELPEGCTLRSTGADTEVTVRCREGKTVVVKLKK